jgi:hypothetical protein
VSLNRSSSEFTHRPLPAGRASRKVSIISASNRGRFDGPRITPPPSGHLTSWHRQGPDTLTQRRSPDAGQSRCAAPLVSQLKHLCGLGTRGRLSPLVFPVEFGLRDALFLAFQQQATLELSDGAALRTSYERVGAYRVPIRSPVRNGRLW